MKIKGKPLEVANQILDKLDTYKEEQEIIVYISKTETKEMILHTQRKMLRWLCSEISKFMWEKPERVKQIFLIWCFGSEDLKMWKFTTQVANKPTTSELTKKETIFYIDVIWKFICDNNIACKYTPREIQSLIDSLNNN